MCCARSKALSCSSHDETADHGGKFVELGHRASVDLAQALIRMADQLHDAALVFVGQHLQLFDGGFADAPHRIIDHAKQGLLIVGIDHEPEVGEEVFHLLAAVERQTSINFIGNALTAKGFLDGA